VTLLFPSVTILTVPKSDVCSITDAHTECCVNEDCIVTDAFAKRCVNRQCITEGARTFTLSWTGSKLLVIFLAAFLAFQFSDPV
jgi:hypothetical protein